MTPLSTDQNNIFFRCVEDSVEAIMFTDRSGRLTYVNPAWRHIYGYSSEEALGETPRLLRSQHQSDEFYKSIWNQILDPKIGSWKGRLVNRGKTGEEVPVLLTITPMRENGEVSGYMGIALDMREQLALEAKLLQQDRLASIGLLASGVAHEIGTPLGVVRGRAELLKVQNRDNPHLFTGLDIIITQIDRVSQLITNLLNLSRARGDTSGTAVLRRVFDEALSLIAQKFRETGVELHDQIDPNVVVRVMHNELEQVVINLLVNALHAVQSAVAKGRLGPHEIKVSNTVHGSRVLVEVEDTGCGISKDHLKDIFRPFFTTKDVGEGTGLGLSISYQIIHSAGGEIHVESTEGKGTKFTLDLMKA